MGYDNFSDYKWRADSVSRAEIFLDCFAITVSESEGVQSPTVLGAQIANELLDISGIEALIQTIKERKLEDVGIVFSALMDKDCQKMLDMLKEFDVVIADFDDERSQGGHIPYQKAIEIMKAKHQNIVVTGSLHFVSTVRKYVISA